MVYLIDLRSRDAGVQEGAGQGSGVSSTILERLKVFLKLRLFSQSKLCNTSILAQSTFWTKERNE